MTPPRPQQGLPPARALNCLECGTAPPGPAPRAPPRAPEGRRGQLVARAAGPPTARPVGRADTNTADPAGAQPGRPEHWAPVSSTGTAYPQDGDTAHCPGEAGPSLHPAEGGRPLFTRGKPHGKRPRTCSWLDPRARKAVCQSRQKGTQRILEPAGSQVGGWGLGAYQDTWDITPARTRTRFIDSCVCRLLTHKN